VFNAEFKIILKIVFQIFNSNSKKGVLI